MKKLFVFCLLGFLGFAVLGSYAPIYAYPVVSVGQSIRFGNGPGTTGGGEFEVYDDASGAYLYNSFCVETDEFLNYSDVFIIDDISTEARGGGSGGPSPDPISLATAYLYHHFYWGSLPYSTTLGDYVYGSDTSANYLQKAIWWLEGETLGVYNDYVALAQAAVAGGAWTSLGDVRVLNLVYRDVFYADGTRKRAQDQLVVVPVPEADTMLLLGFGLISLVGIGRTRLLKRSQREEDKR